jgi:hypothetical protein
MNKVETIRFLYESLKPVQKIMFTQFIDAKNRMSVFHCSRRLGKTHLLCVLSVCFALKKSGAQIRYASVTQKAVRKMVHPIFKEIFNKLPTKYRGKWNGQEGAYIFKNGSFIHCLGVNGGHSDDARGTATDLALIDEAAFVDELGYLVDSVLMPQLLTVLDSRLIMASSSPISPAHEFCEYITKAKIDHSYHSYSIYDGQYRDELIAEFCKEAGGDSSTAWRREYLNEVIVDEDFAIIPEASKIKGVTAFNPSNRHWYQNYVSMDIGIRDLTVVLFGYYDFKRAKLCIEHEWSVNGPRMTTPLVAENIKRIEGGLFKSKDRITRIADNNNLLLLQDLGYLHDCHFIPTSKDSLEAMVNEMRIWFKDGRIEIHEGCTLLLESVKFGFWNEQRSAFGRSSTLGHFDAIASLMYMIRNVDVTTNPIPVQTTFDDFYIDETENENAEQLSALLRL